MSIAVVGLAVGLILAGLLIIFLSPSAGRMATVFWWVGAVLAVVGLVLLVTPVLVWVDHQLRMILG